MTLNFIRKAMDQFYSYYGNRPCLAYVPDEETVLELTREIVNRYPLIPDPLTAPRPGVRFVLFGVPFELNSNLKPGQLALCDGDDSQIYLDTLLFQENESL